MTTSSRRSFLSTLGALAAVALAAPRALLAERRPNSYVTPEEAAEFASTLSEIPMRSILDVNARIYPDSVAIEYASLGIVEVSTDGTFVPVDADPSRSVGTLSFQRPRFGELGTVVTLRARHDGAMQCNSISVPPCDSDGAWRSSAWDDAEMWDVDD